MAWAIATAAILLVSDRAEAVLVVFSGTPPAIALPAGVALLSWNGRVGRFVGARPGFVRDLYAAGALVVLPIRKQGCLALRAGKSG